MNIESKGKRFAGESKRTRMVEQSKNEAMCFGVSGVALSKKIPIGLAASLAAINQFLRRSITLKGFVSVVSQFDGLFCQETQTFLPHS